MISVFKPTSSFNTLWDKKEQAKRGVEYGTHNVSVQFLPHAVGRKDSQYRVYFKLSVADTLTCLCSTSEVVRLLRERVED